MTSAELLVKPGSTKSFAKREAGGKGFNLYLMTSRGLPVPDWVVLPKRAWERFAQESGFVQRLDQLTVDLKAGQKTPLLVSQEVEKLILGSELTPSLRAWIESAYACAKPWKLFSIRSSAADEDGGSHSFAGQLSSFLYVEGLQEAILCTKKCWASAFSERALAYRLENDISFSGASVAVVFQRMIDPDKSGVMFTCDPIEKTLERMTISSVYGVGEGLVSGALEADTFWINARTGELERSELVAKENSFRRGAQGECQTVAVSANLRDQPSLSDSDLKALFALGKKIDSGYSSPQDIEWAIQGSQVYLLQTRPVTTMGIDLKGYMNLWDNSNIIESYGDLTLPLSFTFALNNYKNVYVQFCEILGVPNELIKDMDDYLRNMLGSINGRVYYNLYNWYKLVGVLPGFQQNKEFMETMMGVSEALTQEINERISPHPSWTTWKGKLRKIRTGLSFIYYHFAIQGIVEKFLTDFKRDYLRFRARDYSAMTSDQIFRVYIDMERNMIGKWKAPIINDFLCMVHFGVLRKLTQKWLSGLDSTIQNDLLAGEGNLESAEPTKTLIRMAGKVIKNADLKKLIEETAAEDLLEVLTQSSHLDFCNDVLSYIDRFGFRCMSEMKLEEIDLYSDPSYLFVCLKNYLRTNTTSLDAIESREKELRSGAESKVRNHLSGFKKLFYFWSLKHARKAVKNRENTRFARTRAYGVVRSMMQGMGADLENRGVLDKARDIFWLTIEEIYGIHQGTLPSTTLNEFVALRKKQFEEEFRPNEPKPRFLTRGAVYWKNEFIVEDLPDEAPTGDWDVKGLPCCPGIVEGVVKVVENPQDDLSLNGEILVTHRTDPGWVPLYPSLSGLLVERGSLLSHSAIVAREMGLPAIVSIPGLRKKLKSGMRIRMDGKAGTVKILEGGESS